jgi:hypothetical protein
MTREPIFGQKEACQIISNVNRMVGVSASQEKGSKASFVLSQGSSE